MPRRCLVFVASPLFSATATHRNDRCHSIMFTQSQSNESTWLLPFSSPNHSSFHFLYQRNLTCSAFPSKSFFLSTKSILSTFFLIQKKARKKQDFSHSRKSFLELFLPYKGFTRSEHENQIDSIEMNQRGGEVGGNMRTRAAEKHLEQCWNRERLLKKRRYWARMRHS
jgi:hypothetical protein